MIKNQFITIDTNNTSDGCFLAHYLGDDNLKCQLQIAKDDKRQNITVVGKEKPYPLAFGDGIYKIEAVQQVSTSSTAARSLAKLSLDVKLKNEFVTFLGPNTYCMWDESSMVWALMQNLKHKMQSKSDLECVNIIYRWVCDNTLYDTELAATVDSFWLPHPDKVIETGKCICWGYSSLVAAMCRIKGIPCKICVGKFRGTWKHAWNEIYTKTAGFVDGVRFDANTFNRLDVTHLDGSNGMARDIVMNNDNYSIEYLG